ncbi:MAG: hypothetical protein J6S67_12345 [Methanobrevibacter sp.]|nr:hypothetical protein [Methanobrevibacter sp.]
MLITNFASGELSENLNGRVDLRQYYQGAARIENFEIIPTGGIKRRPGTKRLAQLSGNSRIIPFIVDKNFVYVLEMYQQGIDVWKLQSNGTLANIQTILTDYTSAAEIREIQYAQNYDTIIFVHKNYKPIIIKRVVTTTTESFTKSDMAFDFYPDVQLDDDFDYVMIATGSKPTKTATTDGHGRFTYYTPTESGSELVTKDYPAGITKFYCVYEGKLYEWVNTDWANFGNDTPIDTELFSAPTRYPACVAFFNNRLFFASNLKEPQKVWASAAPDSRGVRYNDFSTYKKYITVNRAAKEADMHVFTCDINPVDVSGGHTTLRNVTQDFTQGLEHPLTDYYITGAGIPVGTKVLSATVNTLVIDTDKVEFPERVTTTMENDQPVVTTEQYPLTNLACTIQLWRSSEVISSEDYDVFVVSNNITTADCSLFFELASDQNDAIMFLSSNRFLAVGTESSIWSIDPGINALSINAMMQGRYGSDNIQGQAVETATVYFAQGRKGIREFYYDGESSAFRTNNIALLADHILRESAVLDFDFMTNPYARLILVQNNGNVAQMTYDKTNGIMAWSRITMSVGKIRNCAITRGDDENDLIFFVVEDGTDINDNPLYYLEMLDLNHTEYLDSCSEYTGVTTGYNDGAILYNKTTGKTCPYDDIPLGFVGEGDTVIIGYKFTSYIKSMPVIGNDPSKRIRITALLVRFLNSYRPVMKCTDKPDEKFTSIHSVPYSGIAQVTYPGTTDHDVCFELEADDIHPVNILSVDAKTA